MNVLKYLGFLIFYLQTITVWGKCHIQVPPKILFLKKAIKIEQIQEIIISSNCSRGNLQVFLNTVQNIEGKISSLHFNRLMQEEQRDVRVDFRPDNIEIFHLETVIKNKFSLKRELNIESVEVVNPIYVIAIKSLSDIRFQCHACNTAGVKNLSIIYSNSLDDYNKNIWSIIKISQLHKIIVATSDIRAFSKDSIRDHVEMVERSLDGSERYLKSLLDLKYFTANKYIKRGTPIKYSDIIPKKLVKAGQIADVIIVKGGLRLQSKGVSKESGKYRDFINLYNPETKKEIRGQVIGFNKVRVEI